MVKKFSTKRALIASVLMLSLCFSMLVGTTFAWFTDSVSSSGNVIQTGKLDVAFYYADGEEAVPAAGAAEWKKASEGKIFNYSKWEPGYVAARHLRIANEGTLALKYQMRIIANGDVSELSDVIDVYYFSTAAKLTRDTVESGTKLGTLTDVLDPANANAISKIIAGTLDAGKDSVITLALKMRESAGNDYQELDIGANFSVQIIATQAAAENDSFDNQYDAGAEYDGEITNSDGFKAALAAGGSYKVMSDFALEGTAVIPAGKSVELNLNGKNITASATAIENNGELVIINKAPAAAFAMRATLIGGGIDVSSATEEANVINNYGKLTVNGGSYIGADPLFSYAILSKGDLTINDATVIGGFGGVWVYGGGNTVINGGYYTQNSDQGGHVVYAKSSKLTINGGEFEGMQNINCYQYVVYANADAEVAINAGTFSATTRVDNAQIMFADNSPVTVKGGIFDKNPTNFVVNRDVLDNGDGTWTVTMDKDNIKTEISNALADALLNGETEVEVDAHGADVGGLGYGLNTSLVPAGTTVTIKNAVVSGQSYGNAVAGTVVFENCVFNNKSGAYSIHFDAGEGNVVFKNCELAGWCSFGSAIKSVSFEGCKFYRNDHYGNFRFYQPVNMTECEFAPDVTVDASSNCELVLDNCSVTDGSYITSVFYIDDCFTGVTIDGVKVAYTQDSFKDACAQNATVYVIGNDAGEIYDLNGNQKDGMTVIGLGNDVKLVNNTKYASGNSVGAIWQAINLENVTLTNTVYTMADGGNATFTSVNFAAGFRQGYGKNVKFTNCTFGSNSEGYALHFQSDSASEGGVITLDGCKFEGGKVHLGGKRSYEFTNCEFAEGTDFQVWSNITLTGCTVNGVAVTSGNIATLFPKLNLEKVTLN